MQCGATGVDEALAALAEWHAGVSGAAAMTFTSLAADDRAAVRLAALKYGLTVRSAGARSAGMRKLIVKTPEAEAAATRTAELRTTAPSESVVSTANDGARQANLFVWVLLSSHSRMLAHLTSSRQLPCAVQVLRGEGSQQLFRQSRNNGHALLAARCESIADASTVAAALVSDENLAYPLRKVFVVEEIMYATVGDAAAALVVALDAAAKAAKTETPGDSRVTVRLQCWPKVLLSQTLAALPDEAKGWNLSPQSPGGIVASIVQLASGAFKVGVSPAETYAGSNAKRCHGESGGAIDAQICRAFYKLQEAVQVARVDENFSFAGAMAVDAGAAPGGWTKFLAGDRGCARVYAVDPADIDVKLLSSQDNVRHVRSKVQEAMPVIMAELASEGKQLDIFVTDLCPHHAEELHSILQPLLTGMLRPGGLLVVTFKFGSGYTEEAFDKQAAQEVAKLDGLLQTGRTTLVHLMANRIRERTLIGYAANGAEEPEPEQ
jgi:23S rRNA U2552 (ribose-2'-O)-methylase RlmE/FtsJ